MKYDELIKDLRICASTFCESCEKCSHSNEHGDCYNGLKRSAADAIEELQSQLPKWIPVSERLPEEGRYVLVVYETIAGLLCHVSMLWTYATGDYYWDGLHGINPTHWMPLPEPPKEETDG